MMQAADIVAEIAYTLSRQAEALGAGDFERLDALAGLISSLNDELQQAVIALDDAERGVVAAQLAAVIEDAAQLCLDAELRREETRHDLRDLRTGQAATSAYRQALPREAALNYSRQG